jgi:hypothetical protein
MWAVKHTWPLPNKFRLKETKHNSSGTTEELDLKTYSLGRYRDIISHFSVYFTATTEACMVCIKLCFSAPTEESFDIKLRLLGHARPRHHFIFNLGFSATIEASLHIEIGILYLHRGIVSHFICTSQPPPRHNCTFKLYLLATIKIITQLNFHLSATIKSLFKK